MTLDNPPRLKPQAVTALDFPVIAIFKRSTA